ncbi:MAG: alpha-ketoacid dehydrogenase subunit beta [Spirochaetia bacterium]|nr:alpha-ketoacid dehydrogenase subunit beta [Spirochaetia bacterium]
MKKLVKYSDAIRFGFEYLLSNYQEVFTIGQGLWSPWYVGNSMKELEVKFGKHRIIDSPVSEAGITGAAIGASLCGYRPIVIHPRMDFMILAADQIVNQAAKWSHMLGGRSNPKITIRSVINRGGEQGAQHSQALHAWYAHIPGLRVVMPATVQDARDLLISSVLCDDPVIYIDDRWLYEREEEISDIEIVDLKNIKPKILKNGSDLTLVSSGYSTLLCLETAEKLKNENIHCDVIDMRVINPLDVNIILESVKRTKKLCVVDGGWAACGLAGEIIASVVESIEPNVLTHKPVRITLPWAPAPMSRSLEKIYYPDVNYIHNKIKTNFINK